MTTDMVAAIAAAFSGINLVVIVTLAYRTGRWTGSTDQRLANIERHLKLNGHKEGQPT